MLQSHSEEIYDSANRPHPLVEEIQALFKYQNLITQFISRSIKARYKRSALGVVWTLLNPLLTMLVLTLVFSQVFRFDIPYYPVYVLSGLVMWNFFSSATRDAMAEMVWNGNLLNRIYVPKSVFAVSAVGTGLVNLGLSLIPLFAIALVSGMRLHLALLSMPLAVLLLVGFALGLGLILATSAVYFADVLPVYDVILTIWMYATPIIYKIDLIAPRWQFLFKLNPLYYMITLFRDPLYVGTLPSLDIWIIAALLSLLSLVVGSLVFTAKSNEYAYRV